MAYTQAPITVVPSTDRGEDAQEDSDVALRERHLLCGDRGHSSTRAGGAQAERVLHRGSSVTGGTQARGQEWDRGLLAATPQVAATLASSPGLRLING